MSVQKYPWLVSIYKGEDRILIIPIINNIGGYRVESGSFIRIENEDDIYDVGNGVLEAIDIIKNSPLSCLTQKERDLGAAWKKNSRYKSWLSFWKNNNHATIKLHADKHYVIYSAKRSEQSKGGYGACIKMIDLPPTATAREIGEAVIDVFKAAEEYYKDKPAYDPYPVKSLKLMDDSVLTVKHPRDRHFVDYEDAGAAEIYQSYCYLPQEDAESSADFFVGIAPELDCNLDPSNVRREWERLCGKADFFEMQEADCGIFRLRAEMRNKSTHKISYFLQMEEDLLLECSMDVNQPNRRKKLDEKLSGLFEEFALSCKR